jgi:thioredoxin-dependent peroxiredoxin
MRKSVLSLVVGCGCLLLGWLLWAGLWAGPSVAANPDDFTLESPTHNQTFKLKDARGKVVAVHFLLKTECPVCLRHTHAYARWAQSHPDVVQLFVKPDSVEEISGWTANLSKADLEDLPPIFRDPNAELAGKYGIPNGYKFHGQVVRYPGLVVLGKDGKELFRYVGKSNTDRMSVTDFEKRLAESATR